MIIDMMMKKLEYDKNRSRVKTCPCGKNNKDHKFAPYAGFENKGSCHSCGKTFLPDWQKDELGTPAFIKQYSKPKDNSQPIDFIPAELYKKQLINGKHLYSQNHFVLWLVNPARDKCAFESKTVQSLIEMYWLGNSGQLKYNGWVLFPYIDIEGRVRDIKAMDYNPDTGKRIKEPWPKCLFIGKEVLKNPSANTTRCFYGEHLLQGNNKPAKVFESEATATYAAPFFPEMVCIATGGNNGCKWTEKDKCKVLQGREVILYPDIDAHEAWEKKAEIIRSYGINVLVSQLIKEKALKYAEETNKDYNELVNDKYDMRDILKVMDLRDFHKPVFEPEQKQVEQAGNLNTAVIAGELQSLTYEEPLNALVLKILQNNAFVDANGTLYIKTPFSDTYTVYPSIEDYNKRLCLPTFQKRKGLHLEGFIPVIIEPGTLNIK